MGCWGIKAFESDTGLNSVGIIRDLLPSDGKLEINKLIKTVSKNEWFHLPDVTAAHSHTGAMALAEIIVDFLDGNAANLDCNCEKDDNKFGDIISFTVDKKSIKWMRDYIADTVKFANEKVENEGMHSWRLDEDWHGWNDHMNALAERLFGLPDDVVELVQNGQEIIQQNNFGLTIC